MRRIPFILSIGLALLPCAMAQAGQLALRGGLPGVEYSPSEGLTMPELRGGTADFSQGGDGDLSSVGLRGSIERAMDSSPLILSVDAQARAADALVLKRTMSFLPTVNLEFASTRLFDGDRAFNTMGREDGFSSDSTAAIALEWTIFDGFQNYYSLRSAESAALAAKLSAQATRDDVAFDTVQSYLDFLTADSSIALVNKHLKLMKRLASAVREKRKVGFASDADVMMVESDLATLRQQLVTVEADRGKALDRFSSVTGRSGTPRPLDSRVMKRLEGGQEALVQQALHLNPRLRAARYNSDAAQYSTRAARGRYLPRVNLIGSYRTELGDDFLKRDGGSWAAGIKLTVPLVDPATMGDVRRTSEAAISESYRASEVQRQVALETRMLWKDYVAGGARQDLSNTKIAAQRRVIEALEQQFKLGMVSLTTLLDQQRQLMSAELEGQQIRSQKNAAICQLLIVAGAFEPALFD
jgi:outer membrane protein TolC